MPEQDSGGNDKTEARQLRRTVRDLVALATMPATWIGREPQEIARGIADSLTSALELDAIYVRLNHSEEPPSEICYSENCPAFANWLEEPESNMRSDSAVPTQRRAKISVRDKFLHIAITPVGLDAEGGLIVVAAHRSDFPTDLETVLLSVAAAQVQISFLGARAISERKRTDRLLQALRENVDLASMFEEIVGESPALRRVLTLVTKVAPTDSTVLLTGETGTGKELVARAIHKRSARFSRPFVSVNCGALPAALISSELFGHEKGAFTGAQQRHLGRFEVVQGGTIFLDEIGDLSLEVQITLLRVLQERQFERLGGTRPITADVRVIAATNRDLKAATAAGTFRLDLFYRLNIFPIQIPALRERKQDLPMLVEHFVKRYAAKMGKKIGGIERKTFDLCQAYDWPGNVRELQNVIERSVILCSGDAFSIDEGWLVTESSPSRPRSSALAASLRANEKEMIEAALLESKGRVGGPSGAANKLRLAPSTLETKIKALKIEKHRFAVG